MQNSRPWSKPPEQGHQQNRGRKKEVHRLHQQMRLWKRRGTIPFYWSNPHPSRNRPNVRYLETSENLWELPPQPLPESVYRCSHSHRSVPFLWSPTMTPSDHPRSIQWRQVDQGSLCTGKHFLESIGPRCDNPRFVLEIYAWEPADSQSQSRQIHVLQALSHKLLTVCDFRFAMLPHAQPTPLGGPPLPWE